MAGTKRTAKRSTKAKGATAKKTKMSCKSSKTCGTRSTKAKPAAKKATKAKSRKK
jgi:hypothetical protein